MSGIAGICRVDGGLADPALLARMTEALSHRGRDGEGQWAKGPIALGHRLFATTPASLREKAPVADAAGQCWITWDGRVDDRAVLGAERATSAWSDAEMILEIYRARGEDAFARIAGDFALALWDERTRTLLCARDALGVKPLYYHWNGRRLLFASEIKALFADPDVGRGLDEATVADLLLMGFRDSSATFFAEIRRLPPGHVLRLRPHGVEIVRYWTPASGGELRYRREDDYLDHFTALFRDAVGCRLPGRGPVAMLLSGGIDSTSVAATAESLRADDPGLPPLEGLTLFDDEMYAEEAGALEWLELVYGTPIRRVVPSAGGAPVTSFEPFMECGETPHHDGLPTVPLLLEPARNVGCRTLLSGFGADELSQSAEDGFLADLLRAGRLLRLRRDLRLRAAAYGGDASAATLLWLLWGQLSPAWRRRVKTLAGRQVPEWIEPAFAKRVGMQERTVERPPRTFPTWCQETTYRALTNPATVFALDQMDAVASAFGLECRYPYLDRRLIEFFLAVPADVKLGRGYRKQFVQHALASAAGPARGAENTHAVGSRDPELTARLEARCWDRELFGADARVFAYVRRAEAEQMRDRYLGGHVPSRTLLWNLVKLERWLKQWAPEGTVVVGAAA
ncbi:MAG TPA: asparagine synthase-related protein [Methylomirabilota bacterium]|jgi:asparagine synthase (glutamine-hydrolysing)